MAAHLKKRVYEEFTKVVQVIDGRKGPRTSSGRGRLSTLQTLCQNRRRKPGLSADYFDRLSETTLKWACSFAAAVVIFSMCSLTLNKVIRIESSLQCMKMSYPLSQFILVTLALRSTDVAPKLLEGLEDSESNSGGAPPTSWSLPPPQKRPGTSWLYAEL